MDADETIRAVREAYHGLDFDVSAAVERHAGYQGAHLSVGPLFVKTYGAGVPEAAVAKHSAVQAHLSRTGALRSHTRVPVPRVHATAHGALYCTVRGGERPVRATVCDKAPGRTLRHALGGACIPASLIATVGDAMGRSVQGLSSFHPPPQWTAPTAAGVARAVAAGDTSAEGYWCLSHACAHLPYATTAVSDAAVRTLAVRALEEVEGVVSSAATTTLTPAWIHGDLHEDNILLDGPVQEAGVHSLCIVDWDDSLPSFAVMEVAVAMGYLLMPLLSPPPPQGDEHGRSTQARLEGAAAGMGSTLLYHFCRRVPLTAPDCAALLPLVRARLAVSLTSSSRAAPGGNGGEGATAHAGPAAALLAWLYEGGDARVAALTGAWTRAAEEGSGSGGGAGGVLRYVPHSLATLSPEQTHTSTAVIAWLQARGRGVGFHPVIACPRAAPPPSSHAVATSAGACAPTLAWRSERDEASWPAPPFVYDYTGGTPAAGADQPALIEVVGAGDEGKLARFTDMMLHPLMEGSRLVRLGWGRYAEDRVIYTSEHFTGGGGTAERPASEPRTFHLGVDLEAPAGTPVTSPCDGVVHSWAYNREDLDYGPAVVLQHDVVEEGCIATFYTLYGHLSLKSILADGPADCDAGGTEVGMGGWAGDYPGVCRRSDFPAYQLLTPDPNLILRCPWVAPVGPWEA